MSNELLSTALACVRAGVSITSATSPVEVPTAWAERADDLAAWTLTHMVSVARAAAAAHRGLRWLQSFRRTSRQR